jgi:hypothetical protein
LSKFWKLSHLFGKPKALGQIDALGCVVVVRDGKLLPNLRVKLELIAVASVVGCIKVRLKVILSECQNMHGISS